MVRVSLFELAMFLQLSCGAAEVSEGTSEARLLSGGFPQSYSVRSAQEGTASILRDVHGDRVRWLAELPEGPSDRSAGGGTDRTVGGLRLPKVSEVLLAQVDTDEFVLKKRHERELTKQQSLITTQQQQIQTLESEVQALQRERQDVEQIQQKVESYESRRARAKAEWSKADDG